MHSCKVRDGDLRFSREGDCTWMRISDRDIDYEAGSGGVAATDYASIVNMGIQRALSEHWHGGMAIGFEKSDFDIPLFAEDSEFIVSERYVRFFSAYAGYGYNFEGDNWFIQPGLDLGWTDVSGDAFDERGSGPTAMYVQETDDGYLTSRFDLRVGGEFSGSNQMLYRPYINTSYTHVLSGTTNEIRAKLVGAPESVPYFTQILEVDDNYTSVALGIDILARENWALSFEYDWQFAGSWDSHAFFAKAMFQL